jgi:hypothetical protein
MAWAKLYADPTPLASLNIYHNLAHIISSILAFHPAPIKDYHISYILFEIFCQEKRQPGRWPQQEGDHGALRHV